MPHPHVPSKPPSTDPILTHTPCPSACWDTPPWTDRHLFSISVQILSSSWSFGKIIGLPPPLELVLPGSASSFLLSDNTCITHVPLNNWISFFLSVCRRGGVRDRSSRHVPAHPPEGLSEGDLHRLRLLALLLCRNPHGHECKINIQLL